MKVVPCTFKKAKLLDESRGKAYWVSLYCFFAESPSGDEPTCHCFLHDADCVENICLATECGLTVSRFTREIFVDKTHFSKIYQMILDYVHASNFD